MTRTDRPFRSSSGSGRSSAPPSASPWVGVQAFVVASLLAAAVGLLAVYVGLVREATAHGARWRAGLDTAAAATTRPTTATFDPATAVVHEFRARRDRRVATAAF